MDTGCWGHMPSCTFTMCTHAQEVCVLVCTWCSPYYPSKTFCPEATSPYSVTLSDTGYCGTPNVWHNVKEFQFIRKMNNDTMASFSTELSQQTWESVLKTDDVNQAYDSSTHIYGYI